MKERVAVITVVLALVQYAKRLLPRDSRWYGTAVNALALALSVIGVVVAAIARGEDPLASAPALLAEAAAVFAAVTAGYEVAHNILSNGIGF